MNVIKLLKSKIIKFQLLRMRNLNYDIIDKNIPRKNKIVRDKIQYLAGTKIPLMSVVEISNSGMCNKNVHFAQEVIQIILILMSLYQAI